MNSSRVIQFALDNTVKKISEDDFTVSTVGTTESMRMRAAAIASNVIRKGVIYDYDNLTPLHTSNMTAQKRTLSMSVKSAKKIDTAWFVRKHNLCPTHEDVQILHGSDPCVTAKLENRIDDLFCTTILSAFIDENNLACAFSMNIQEEEIYGIVKPKRFPAEYLDQKRGFNGENTFIDTLEMVNMC